MSYSVAEVEEGELTARDLFEIVYAQDVIKRGKKMTHDQLDEYLQEFKDDQ